MDSILISRLEVYAYHGVNPEENRLGQRFYVTAELFFDTARAAERDELEKTVNYAKVCRDIVEFMQDRPYKLIETEANRIAAMLLMKYPCIQEISVELEKPDAPVKYSFGTVSVRIKRRWHDVYLSFGSNIGDRISYIRQALEMLDCTDDNKVEEVSDIIETKPYGVVDQPMFLNGCVHLRTLKTPDALLDQLHVIETALGREHQRRWGPRTVDLDIIFYDDKVIDKQDLHIPHIDMANREFVLRPLAQIAGFKRHPLLGITVDQMLDKLMTGEK